MHWPLIDYECGPETGADTFIEWWHKADRGELEPFVLVVEGSIPNEAIKSEGYWCGFGNNPATGQPMTTNEWLDRPTRPSRQLTGQKCLDPRHLPVTTFRKQLRRTATTGHQGGRLRRQHWPEQVGSNNLASAR